MRQLSKNFTKIPNEVIRSDKLDAYDKMVLLAIASCDPSFPSYETLQRWTGLSRERVWKSLRHLEELMIIQRIKMGTQQIEYVVYWDDRYNQVGLDQVHFEEGRTDASSPDERELVRQTNSTSSPDELDQFARRTRPVRQTNSNNTNQKYILKSVSNETIEDGEQGIDKEKVVSMLGRMGMRKMIDLSALANCPF